MPTDLLPADVAEASLESHLSRFSRRSNAIYIAVLFSIGGALALLPILRVEVSVQADGLVRPRTEKHEVRSSAVGFVEHLGVRLNETVDRGQELVRLSTAPVDARLDNLAVQLRDQEALLHDLEILTNSKSARALLSALRTSEYRQEHVRHLEELTAIELRERQAERDLERSLHLAAENLIPRQDAEDHEYQLEETRTERALLVEGYQSELHRRLARLRLEGADLRARLADAEDHSDRSSIRAPVAGTIEELAGLSAGSFVQVGQELAVISPTSDLIAEVFVSPRDIGLVQPGTPARMLIDAFNYTDWGFIQGQVVALNDDYVLVDRYPMFRVAVELETTHLRLPSGVKGELRKGMTLRARFMVAERSLWQLLRDDINDWLNPLNRPA